MRFKFTRSTVKNKKYDVYVPKDGKLRKVSFGDNRYGQYHDKIGLYKHLDHFDNKRRTAYYKRHGKEAVKYSPKYFSHKYLW